MIADAAVRAGTLQPTRRFEATVDQHIFGGHLEGRKRIASSVRRCDEEERVQDD